MKTVYVIAVVAAVVAGVAADISFLTGGTNNRLNEKQANVEEDNRVFDSQNSAEGGRGWGPPADWVAGSIMHFMLWAQHGTGSVGPSGNELKFQVLCQDANAQIFDGDPSGGDIARDVPDSAIADTAGDNAFKVRHETGSYAEECAARERNRGLFTGAINPGGTAMHTVNNPGGARYGRECAEERENHPYWHPTPWTDVLIQTFNLTKCKSYQEDSGNVKNYGSCSLPQYNNQEECEDNEGVWTLSGRTTGVPPICTAIPTSRHNYNGNVQSDDQGPHPNALNLSMSQVFEPQGSADVQCCTIRSRYNLTTEDDKGDKSAFFDYRNDGYTKFSEDDPDAETTNSANPNYYTLQLAISRNQVPKRIFEDRTNLFYVVKATAATNQCSAIYVSPSCGVRGNYGQAHPNMEHQQCPMRLALTPGSCVDYSLVGTEFQAAGRATRPGATTSKENVCQLYNNDYGTNYPAHVQDVDFFEPSELGDDFGPTVIGACLVGTQGGDFGGGPITYQTGPIRVSRTGTRNAFSAINNNHSNRSDKHEVVVSPNFSIAAIILIVLGSLMVVAGIAFLGAYQYAKKNPDTRTAEWFHSHNMARPKHMRR